jgi:hypothetical protein
MNGKTRKTLAEQIDKMDSILDGLSENLNEAVADATYAAVQEAVQRALVEVLTSPDILALLGGLAPPRQPSPLPVSPPAAEGEDRPGLQDRLGAAHAWAGRQARAAGAACARGLAGLRAGLLGLWRLRTRLLATVAVGTAIGLGAYLAGPWLSALAGGALGFVTGVCNQARSWLQRLWLGLAASGA